MKISEHFTLDELTKSDTAARHNIANQPDEIALANLKILADNVLEPLRAHFGAFRVNSGYRCLELNRLLKSSDKSQHVVGEAADFEIVGISNYDLAVYVRENIMFDQLILEYYEPGKKNSGWCHVSYKNPEQNRGKCMTINKYGTKQGLIK
jgi:zinc D-Ala-D-Ala carboxypeptidase